MKILVDTNILISALLFPHSRPARLCFTLHGITIWFCVTAVDMNFVMYCSGKLQMRFLMRKPF